MSPRTTFGIVGGGWRSHLLLRLADAAPGRLNAAGVVTRTADAGERVTAGWGVPTYRTIDELLKAEDVDYVVAAVSWPAMPGVIRDLVAAGMAVLAETPPAPDVDRMRSLWGDVAGSGLVQVAEQYLLMPGHAARHTVIQDGVIGQATSVEISSTHLYHAVSLIRRLLGVGMDDVVVNARDFRAPLVDPLTFDGWDLQAVPEPRTTTIATLDFGDRMGLYNFVENQWWNPLRTRRIVVRGSRGELVDNTVVRLVDPTSPVESSLVYRRTGVDMNLEGSELVHVSFDGRVVYRNPWLGTRLSEDDIAVASMLEAEGAWVRGEGPEPYPLAQACQDHAIGLAIQESARTGAEVHVAKNVWAWGAVDGDEVRSLPGPPMRPTVR
ncbi:MAG TPA: Gfo/Idh/MocA family oxidoreductase [Acidimicrobiales bacterium]|nr:Gfo/Idh/MocA family oxidoreductase [Acidimicrobiales bacterium]